MGLMMYKYISFLHNKCFIVQIIKKLDQNKLAIFSKKHLAQSLLK